MSRHHPSVLRVVVGALLLVIGVGATPAALGAVWASNTSGNSARFATALGPLGTSAALHTRLTTQMTRALTASLPESSPLTTLLTSPVGAGVLRGVVRKSLDGPRFPAIWSTSVRSAHRQALAELRGDDDSAAGRAGRITVSVDRLLPLLTPQLRALGLPRAFDPPKTHRSVTIATIPHLAAAQTAYARLRTSAVVLPIVALVGLVGGILLLRRRARAIAAAAGGVLLGLAALHVAIGAGRAELVSRLAVPRVGAAVDLLTAPLDAAAWTTAAIAAGCGLGALAVAVRAFRRRRRETDSA